jgi:hypothetical protein
LGDTQGGAAHACLTGGSRTFAAVVMTDGHAGVERSSPSLSMMSNDASARAKALAVPERL